MYVKNFELILTNTFLLNTRTRHLEFKINNDIPLQFKPGQFISLHIEKNSQIVRRNFSIASSPNETNKIEIAATFVPNGIASTTLWNMQIGDQIHASGPFGIFVLRPADLNKIKRYILVATGTGVTPYRSMLNDLKLILRQNADIKIELLLGVRDRYELLYSDDFINFAKTIPSQFKFTACYSREQQSTVFDNSYEYIGYVQNKITELNINPTLDLVYLCGNPNMVDNSLSILEKLGLPRNKIIREKYISSK